MWHATRTPEGRPWALLLALTLTVLAVCCLVQRTWLDPTSGRVRHRRVRLLHWEVPWAEADVVRIRHDFRGMVLLQVRRRGGLFSIYVPLAGDDDRGPRGQPPQLLRLLAGEIRRWGRRPHLPVADALDAQARHLEAGGTVAGSPLLVHHDGFRVS